MQGSVSKKVLGLDCLLRWKLSPCSLVAVWSGEHRTGPMGKLRRQGFGTSVVAPRSYQNSLGLRIVAVCAPALTPSSHLAPPKSPPASPASPGNHVSGLQSSAPARPHPRHSRRSAIRTPRKLNKYCTTAGATPPLGPNSRENSLIHPRTFSDSTGNWEEVPESRCAQTRHANLAPARRKCAGAAAALLLFLVPLPTSGCRVLCRAGPSGG